MRTLSIQQADLIRILQSRHMPRVIQVINLLLVIWIAATLASLTWALLSPQDSTQPVAVVTENVAAPVNPDRQLISQMPAWHLMGMALQGDKPLLTNTPVEAPDTKLKLVLKGALASDDPAHARAIIADPRGKEEQYAVGDKLPGNAELSEIHADRVILKRNGRFETLRLPTDKKSSNKVASRSAGAHRRASSPRQQLTSVRQQLKRGSTNFADLLRVTPKRGKDGKTIGYTLSPGRNPDLFKQVGLQQGDVAIQINNIRLDNPANSARALKSLKGGDSVTVTVVRSGQEKVVSLEWPG